MHIMRSLAMDGDSVDMSWIPGGVLPEGALAVESWLPGGMDATRDGLRHRKTAPCTIIAIAERGSYDVGRADGSRATARTGEAFTAQDGEWLDIIHHADRRGGTFAACWTHLRVTVFGSLDACRMLALPPVLPAAACALIRPHIQATRTAEPGLAGAARRAEAAMATLRALAQSVPPSAEGRILLQRAAGLAPLAAWIRSHLADPLTLDGLAAAAGQSKSRLHARFQRELGMPPMAWVRELRLQAARSRLLATGAAVAAIGGACGFPDPFHFSRAVKDRFGLSPSQLRRRAALGTT